MNSEERYFYRFASFQLDVAERQLLNNDVFVPLTPKAFDVLAVLVERHGHLVEKDELLRLVWADAFVEEANLSRIIHTLRKVLDDDKNGHKFIETVPKKGYRFVAEVSEVREPAGERKTINAPDSSTDSENSSENEPRPPTLTKSAAPIPGTKPKPRRMSLIAIGLVSAVSLFFLLSFNSSSKSEFNPSEVKSIAILPLKSLTAENRDAIYELGIAGSLIFKISSAKNLVVRPLSATQVYADLKKDAVAVGKEQMVDFVLASTYQVVNGKIRVTSELINVSNGLVEESFRDEQPLSNSFAAEDAVTANIGQALLRKLNREPNSLTAKRYTMNDEAYRLYLQGRVLADKRNAEYVLKAIENFEKAIKLDPNYAPAYAGLANAFGSSPYSRGDPHQQYLKQKAAIEKALALDENLAEAYSFLGEMKMNYEWDFAGAEQAHKRALALDPNSSNVHRMYGLYLTSMGRFDEAIAEIKLSIELEPASVLSHRLYGQALFYARRYDEAIVQLERTVEMDPSFQTTYGWLTNSYTQNGEPDKAFECFLRSLAAKAENSEKIVFWKEIYNRSGWRGIREQQLAEAEKKDPPDWSARLIYAELGDKERTLIALEKAFNANERGWRWTTIKHDPRFDFISSDPRFENLLRQIGLKQ